MHTLTLKHHAGIPLLLLYVSFPAVALESELQYFDFYTIFFLQSCVYNSLLDERIIARILK